MTGSRMTGSVRPGAAGAAGAAGVEEGKGVGVGVGADERVGVGEDGSVGVDEAGAGVRPGEELEPLTVPVTRTLIVSGAIASRDFQDVHHDAESARAKGSPDIFMNILTTNGLVGRYLTDRFPGAELRKVSIRLGVPNYPGDTMVLSGRVTEVEGDTVRVEVVGSNDLGKHVTGSATLIPAVTPAAVVTSVPAAGAVPGDAAPDAPTGAEGDPG